MIENVKSIVSPTVNLMKELNTQIKNGEIDPDFLLKLAMTMKVGSMKLEKYIRDNKIQITGGVTKPPVLDEEED